MNWGGAKTVAWRVGLALLIGVVVVPWLRQKTSNPAMEYIIAEADRAQGRYDQAIERFTALIHFHPEYASSYAGRGDSYRHKGDRTRAFADFEAALQHDPRNFEAFFYRCQAHRASGEIDAAIADCQQAADVK